MNAVARQLRATAVSVVISTYFGACRVYPFMAELELSEINPSCCSLTRFSTENAEPSSRKTPPTEPSGVSLATTRDATKEGPSSSEAANRTYPS